MAADAVVVTGIGILTSVGSTRPAFWEALCAGRSGVAPIRAFDTSAFATRIGSELPEFDPTQWMPAKTAKRMGRNSQLAVAAALDAVRDAGVDLSTLDRGRVGCVIGTAAGDYPGMEENFAEFEVRGPKGVSPFCVPKVIPNMPAGNAAIALGVHGPTFAPISACATGAHAIGLSLDLLRAGRADVVLAGGVEATMTGFVLAGYQAMGALSQRNGEPTRASRPFDRDRDGFVMGEGAAVLVLERRSDARARGAVPLAEVAGFGMTADAHGIAQPDPDGRWSGEAMRLALRDADLAPNDIGYINAHGTSTPANDRTETAAIRRLFPVPPPVSSIKSMIGHTLGAAGAIEAAATALALHHGVLPPTINYETPDPECDLDVIPTNAREGRVHAALSNSFGFGGQNGVLAFRRV